MDRSENIAVFDMSPKEFASFIRPIAAHAKQQSRDLGIPDVYKNELCLEEFQFIRRYPSDTKELVAFDIPTRSHTILKRLEK